LDVAPLRITGAGHERTPLAGSLDQRLAAGGAHFTRRFWWRRLFLALSPLDVVTFRIERTADELPQTAHAVNQPAVATLFLAFREIFSGPPHRHLDRRRAPGLHQRLPTGPAEPD